MQRTICVTILCAVINTPGMAQQPATGPNALPAPVVWTTDRADADGDGIPDDIEHILGMDFERPDAMYLVHDDLSAAEGDRTMPSTRRLAPDITKVTFGNAGQDRWVWRIDFVEEFLSQRARVMLYLDADNDPATGRQDGARGTDVRLICEAGAFSVVIRNPDVLARDRELRGVVDGNSVWMSMDLKINHNEDGHAQCRAYILCQMVDPSNDSDRTEWFTVLAPGRRDIPVRPVGLRSQILSEGAVVQKRWLGWREQLRELDAITLGPDRARLDGMKRFNHALEPEAPAASARFSSPLSGERFINLLLQDSAVGLEQVTLRVDGVQVARFTAGQDDGDLYLFSTAKPIALRQGGSIELVAHEPAQDFRICEITLTTDLPRPGMLELRHPSVYVTPAPLPGAFSGDTVEADVCFLTNRPALGLLRWGPGESLEQQTPRGPSTYSHRITLTGLRRGQRYSVQAGAREGSEEVWADPMTFVADQRRLERCGVARGRIALSVADRMPAGRPRWPVNGGIPIPRGQLSSADRCRLLDANARIVPAQFTELAYWPDGSVKWLLVSLVHEPGPAEYVLEYGTEVETPAVDRGITAVETGEGLLLTTDLLQVRLSRHHCALPGEVRLDANGDGRFDDNEIVVTGRDGFVLIDAEGKRTTSSAGPATRFEVEESGPIRTVLRIEGTLRGDDIEGLRYRCRLYFYRGFAGIHAEFALLAQEGSSGFPPTLSRIRSLTWPMQAGPGSATAAAAAPARWIQVEPDQYLDGSGESVVARQGRGPAMATTRVGAAGMLSVIIRDFWQMYPKGFALDGATLTAEMFPELPETQYAEYTDPKLLTMNYYWFRDGVYLVPGGTEPATDMLLYFGPVPSAEETPQFADAWQSTVLLMASPEHVCASGVLDGLEPSRPGRFEHYNRFMREGLDRLETARQQRAEYSWMNYGDTYGERGVNWTNQEYDLQWGLLANFARSGDLAFFERAVQASLHTIAIDMINWSNDSSVLGIQKEHALWHTGGFNTPRIEGAPFWFANGIWNTGHVWTQGTYLTYCLTGERRYYESIERLALFLARRQTGFLERWVSRNYGWLTLAMLGAYHTNPHPYYLNGARFFVQNITDRQDPGTGALVHPIGECEHHPRHMGGKSFMTGVAMSALNTMDRLEPDEAMHQAIVLCAEWLHTRMWDPEHNGFRYAQCPQFDRGAGHPAMECEGLARAFEIAGNPQHREILLLSLGRMIREGAPSNSGKGYATQIRMTPWAVSALDRWGLDEIPPPPPRPPRVIPPGQVYMAPGRNASLSLTAVSASAQALEARAEIVEMPAGLEATPRQVQWTVTRGTTRSPAMQLSGKVRTGDRIRVRWNIGPWQEEVMATVHLGQAIEIGAGIGYVGDDQDPVGQALEQLGMRPEPLTDLAPATLARYRALLVGREAHEKNFLGIREQNAHLLDFMHSGGRVVFIQLQDSSWQPSWLPAPLTLSDRSGHLTRITVPEHPIFTTPHRLKSVAGIISYDTIVEAGEPWTVLARDNRGQPAIVEMSAGKGRVLLVQPSPDRYVIGSAAPGTELSVDTCAKLLENLLAYLNRTE